MRENGKVKNKGFVCLINDPQGLHVNVDKNKLDAMKVQGKFVYKLANQPGVIWMAEEAKDELYSEFERVQPAERNYAAYYKVSPTTFIIRPRDVLKYSKQIQLSAKNGEWDKIKRKITEYIRVSTKNERVQNVICEIDSKRDVSDLHRLFGTNSVQDVVKGYAKSFSGVFWNYLGKGDPSFFQVPTLMITDKTAVTEPKLIPTVSYLRRKNGVNKYTGKNSMQISKWELYDALNQKLDVDLLVDLLKVREIFADDKGIVQAIDEKICNSPLMQTAIKIKEQDRDLIQIARLIDKKEKNKIRKEIAPNKNLQQGLRSERLSQQRMDDKYLSVYTEMLEESRIGRMLEPKRREKGLFRRQKAKALPEPTIQKIQPTQAVQTKKKVHQAPILEEKKEEPRYPFNSLEWAIQEFLYSYLYENETGYCDEYSALVNLCGKNAPEYERGDKVAESNLLSELNNDPQYTVLNQNNAFRHVMTKAWDQSKLKIDTRFYLNPKRENLIPLVREILKRNEGKPLYLKFETEDLMEKSCNKENVEMKKIVIYTNKGESGNAGRIAEMISQIKQEQPQLFVDAQYMNPFMKSLDNGIAYSNSSYIKQYTRINGRRSEVSNSYNSILAEALGESMNAALHEIATSGRRPGFEQLDKFKQLSILLEESPREIVEPMKRYLIICQRNNPVLNIKGIDDEKNIENRPQSIER